MAVLLILASPHVLSEPSGAGARPVHPIRVISWRRSNSVAFGAKRTFSEQRLPIRFYEYAPQHYVGADATH
jgi:hypothetical protein